MSKCAQKAMVYHVEHASFWKLHVRMMHVHAEQRTHLIKTSQRGSHLIKLLALTLVATLTLVPVLALPIIIVIIILKRGPFGSLATSLKCFCTAFLCVT